MIDRPRFKELDTARNVVRYIPQLPERGNHEATERDEGYPPPLIGPQCAVGLRKEPIDDGAGATEVGETEEPSCQTEYDATPISRRYHGNSKGSTEA